MSKRLVVKQFAAGSCYSYIVSCARDALVIDPHISLLSEYSSYIERRKLKLAAIVDTHTHADHFSLAAVMKKRFGAPLIMSERSISAIVNRRVKDGDEIALGAAALKVIATPGHTDDAISLYTGAWLFTGDTLLIGSVGRTDFQNGSPESMFESLQKLKALPGATIVYPGHDYHEKQYTTIGRERRDNPYMKETNQAVFTGSMRAKVLPKPFNIDTIVRVNQSGRAAAIAMVSPREAERVVTDDPAVKLLDVRSALEFSQERIAGAMNIPIDMLGLRVRELAETGNTYIVLCRAGTRSPMAADMLLQAGIQGVRVLDGGITRWKKDSLSVIRGVGGISIERQTRILAGSLVLISVVLALTVHIAYIGIAVFVGCGLLFAGITDACLSAALLMKLPYNKRLYKTTLGGTCAMGG